MRIVLKKNLQAIIPTNTFNYRLLIAILN